MSRRATSIAGKGPQKEKHVYKEIFFAGFPPSGSSDNAELVQPFDGQFIHDFFHHYGEIERFVYKDTHGVGSVTFVSGDDAERFYLAVHLSVLDCPVLVPVAEEKEREKETVHASESGHRASKSIAVMLYLEFAQACPFANPQVLLKDELLSGEMSRWALQFSAPPEGLTATTAETVVAEWVFCKKRKATGAEQPSSIAANAASRVEVLEDNDGGADVSSMQNAERDEGTVEEDEEELVLVGPNFPGLPARPAELQAQMWRLLRPTHFTTKKAPSEPTRVVVLDLWYEFYKTYVLHKTQPESSRIADPQLRFAQQPSLVQRIKAMHARTDQPVFARQLRRLAEDDVFHGSLTYVWMLQKYKYDPVWSSFMRDTYTDKVSALVQVHLAEWDAILAALPPQAPRRGGRRARPGKLTAATAAAPELAPQTRMALAFAAQRHDLLEMRAAHKTTEEASANTWAELGVFVATENLLENVEYLRLVRLGRVDKSTGEVISYKEKMKRKAETSDGTVDEDAYPLTGTNRQKEEFLYAEIIRMLDGYVQTGAATELLYLCESPTDFRSSPGHVGYDELHHERYTRRQYWLGVLNALWVPLILIALFVWVVQKFIDPEDLVPKRPVGRGSASASQRTPSTATSLEALQESLKQAEAMAKRRGGQFSFKVEGM